MKNKKIFTLLLTSLMLQACNNANQESSSSSSSNASQSSSSIVESSSSSTIQEREIEKYIVKTNDAIVFAAPNTIAIMSDVDLFAQCEYWGEEWLEDANNLHMSGIKGDVESTQLMLEAKNEITAFNATVSDLSNEDKTQTIAKENINIYAEKYIETKSSSSTPKKACAFAGFYPDALVPMAKYKVRKENKVSKGNYQGLFITVDVPLDIEAGTYTGNVSLTINGNVSEVPVSLKVYNATMPIEVHKKTAFDIWGNEIGYGEIMTDEDDNIIDWYQRYYDFLVSKKVTPQSLNQTSIGQGYAEEAVEAANNPKITGYRLPYSATTVNIDGNDTSVVKYQSIVDLLTIMANKNIELRLAGDNTTDIFKKAFYYFASIIDEPTAAKYPAVMYCDDAVERAKQEVSVLLNDYPDLKKSLLEIPHVVTSRYTNSLSGNTQTWCSQVQAYTSDVLESIDAKKKSTEIYPFGENFWNYMTCDSNNPYPSFQLDDNLMSTRILSWMDFDYGIDCTLFWNTCYYQHYDIKSGAGTRDIWNDPQSWVSANGDGYLLYPGSRYGLDTPIATLRLENFREGVEDYEYLYLIKEAVDNLAIKYSLDIDYKDVVQQYYNKLYKHNSMVPTTNVETFKNTRESILELLDLVTNNEEATLELFQEK